MFKENRVGFKIDELMTGYHEFEKGCGPTGQYKMEFHATWGPKDLSEWINPKSKKFLKQPLDGLVTVEGLCVDVPCHGTFELRYFKDYSIKYSFEFKVNRKTYQYVGKKVNIKPWNLLVSHTTCFGRLTEKTTGKLISTSVTYFKLSSMPKFLTSFRLA